MAHIATAMEVQAVVVRLHNFVHRKHVIALLRHASFQGDLRSDCARNVVSFRESTQKDSYFYYNKQKNNTNEKVHLNLFIKV